MTRLAALCILAACGGSSKPVAKTAPAGPVSNTSGPDDCQRFVDKSRPLLTERGRMGKPVTEDDFEMLLDACRKEAKPGDPMIACVIDAPDDAKVRDCWKIEMSKTKVSEVAINLNKIAKNAKSEFQATSQFIVGKTGPTPAQPCCAGPNHKCPGAWDEFTKDPVWSDVEFIVGEPGLYQYTYEGTATSFRATAIGDLDCDGTFVTWVLEGHANPDGSGVTTTITAPPKGAD